MPFKILMSNLGYMRGINGCLDHHIRYAHRSLYCPVNVQQACLEQLKNIIEIEQPDLCCFVEIEKGNAKRWNQLSALVNENYAFYDIENKYGQASLLRKLPITSSKSNGFVARHKLEYEKIYFTHGTKRLMYKIHLPFATLFFSHFSLKAAVRQMQLLQTRKLIEETPGGVILLGDFNIHAGFKELTPLLQGQPLHVMNREEEPTFTLHKFRRTLDLCICSPDIAAKSSLRIIPQPFSDHAALLLSVSELHHPT